MRDVRDWLALAIFVAVVFYLSLHAVHHEPPAVCNDGASYCDGKEPR